MRSFSSLMQLGRYIKKYKTKFTLVILFTVATVAFNAILPYVTGLQTTDNAKNIAAGDLLNFSFIKMTVIWILLVDVGYAVLQLVSALLVADAVQAAMKDLRRDIDQKINRLPVSYFDSN